MAITVPMLRSWQPDALLDAARLLRHAASDIDGVRTDLRQAWTGLVGPCWAGAAADAAGQQGQTQHASLVDVVEGLEGCAAALAAAGQAFADARRRLSDATALAATAGLTIADDGSVTIPPTVLATASDGSATEQREWAAVTDIAHRAALAAAQALRAAGDADIAAARHLDNAAELADQARARLHMPPEGPVADAALEQALVVGTQDVRAVAEYDLSPEGLDAIRAWWQENGATAGPTWDPFAELRPGRPGEWAAAVLPPGTSLADGLPPGVTVFANASGYDGDGFLTGPDGRSYPLVVPWVMDGQHGDRYTADELATPGTDLDTLDGRDPGWHTLGTRVGLTSIGSAAGVGTHAAVLAGGLAGLQPKSVNAQPAWLQNLSLSPTGEPTVTEQPSDLYTPTDAASGIRESPVFTQVTTDKLGRVTMSEDPMAPAGLPSAVRGVNGLAMLDNFGRGWAASSHLDDERTHAFQVIFQSNDDGRTRALLHTYQVVDASAVGGSSHQVIANSVTVDADGQLKPTPLTFRPTTQAMIKPVPAG